MMVMVVTVTVTWTVTVVEWCWGKEFVLGNDL